MLRHNMYLNRHGEMAQFYWMPPTYIVINMLTLISYNSWRHGSMGYKNKPEKPQMTVHMCLNNFFIWENFLANLLFNWLGKQAAFPFI